MNKANSQISLDITNKCNLGCIYCFKKEQNQPKEELSLDDMKVIYDKYEPTYIRLFGGEPTLRWKTILGFIDYVAPKMKEQQRIIINSNGATNIDFETIPQKHKHRVHLNFSCDGTRQLTIKNKNKDVFNTVIKSIENSVRAGIETSVSFTIDFNNLNNNLKDIIQLTDYFLNTLNLFSVTFSPIVDLNNIELYDNKEKYNNIVSKLMSLYPNKRVYMSHNNFPCQNRLIRIHTNGQINLRCTMIDNPLIGHWTEWSKEDLTKMLNYVDYLKLDCRSKNWDKFNKYVEKLRKERTV